MSDEITGLGSIEVIFGPMFSGKTSELLRRIRRHQLASRRVVVIKYIKDTRYNASRCTTHDFVSCDAICAERLDECRENMKDYDVIGIDEGQFFPDLISFAEDMANRGKTVIVAALDGTYQKKPFGRVLELVPIAESVIKLSAVCMMCKKDAAFSHRISSEKQVEVIGGADKYVALCRACHLKFIPNCAITDFYPEMKTKAPGSQQTKVDDFLAVLPPASAATAAASTAVEGEKKK